MRYLPKPVWALVIVLTAVATSMLLPLLRRLTPDHRHGAAPRTRERTTG